MAPTDLLFDPLSDLAGAIVVALLVIGAAALLYILRHELGFFGGTDEAA